MAVKSLNPWDNQMKRIYETDGQYATLSANSGGGGRLDGILLRVAGDGQDADSESGRKPLPGTGARTEHHCPASGFDPKAGVKARGIGFVRGVPDLDGRQRTGGGVLRPGRKL